MTSSRSKKPNLGISGVAFSIKHRFRRPDIKHRKETDTGAEEESIDDNSPLPSILKNPQRRLAFDFKTNTR